MRVSASQFKNYIRCPRLWWLESVIKIPRGQASYGIVFGNVLHDVLERWLKADGTGRGPDGKPVEIYPEGWDYDKQNNAKISQKDKEAIPNLVDQAVAEGLLKRHPARKVEEWIKAPLIEGVEFVGKVDLHLPFEIQDHKGTKDLRYALSEAKLSEDLQMRLYAACLYPTDAVTVQHNVFARTEKYTGGKLKLPPSRVLLSPEQTSETWDECKELAEEMLSLKEAKLPSSDWKDVSEPEGGMGDPCNAYGGCRFLGVCSGRESLTKLQKRLNRRNENVSVKDKIAAKRKKKKKKAATKKKTTKKTKKKKTTKKKAKAPAVNPEPEKKVVDATNSGLVTLYMGCIPLGQEIPSAEEVWREFVEGRGGISMLDYFSLDPFERRDKVANSVMESPPTVPAMYVSEQVGTDVKAFLSAIRSSSLDVRMVIACK